MEIVFEYRYIIAVVAAVAIWAAFDWQRAKVIIYNGMLKAKSLAKDAILNSGQEQEDWVVERIYPLIPATVRVFVTREMFRKIVQKLYSVGKDWIDDGALNGSVQ